MRRMLQMLDTILQVLDDIYGDEDDAIPPFTIEGSSSQADNFPEDNQSDGSDDDAIPPFTLEGSSSQADNFPEDNHSDENGSKDS